MVKGETSAALREAVVKVGSLEYVIKVLVAHIVHFIMKMELIEKYADMHMIQNSAF